MSADADLALAGPNAPLILASGSAIRARILREAGVPFLVRKSHVDETAIKEAMEAACAPAEAVAQALADEKALAVSRTEAGLVLGADQILRLDGALLDKVADMAAAKDRLRAMRGKGHDLVGALSLARDGTIVARHQQNSRIHVRAFSDEFLEAHLQAAGPDMLASVACYQFEGLGAQLFEAVEGDYHAVLGLPLTPLLALLRREGVLMS